MSSIVLGSGKSPARVMVVGERPGATEMDEGLGFVGPAGEELWDRLWKVCKLTRDEVWVTNLVKTFSMEPPSAQEIRVWAPTLRAELVRVQPSIIITVGYHAARWFLPQFEDINGDWFQGLAFPFRYGRLAPREAVVVPVVHSSAALRQPGRYQNQLTEGMQSVARMLDGRGRVHAVRQVVPYQVGLAGFGRAHQHVGLDTEYKRTPSGLDVECVTLSVERNEAACLEITDNTPPKFLASALHDCHSVTTHMAKAELHACAALGIDLHLVRIDDTMLMAYLLGLPQSLKVLAFRELGYQMSEYEDLVSPLDATLVRSTLRTLYDEGTRQKEEVEQAKRDTKAAAKAAKLAARRGGSPARRPCREDGRAVGQGARSSDDDDSRDGDRRHHDDGEERGDGQRRRDADGGRAQTPRGQAPVPTRALTSLRGILDGDTGQSPRARWEASAYRGLIALPPAPSWRDAPADPRRAYAMTDAIATRELKSVLWPRILDRGLRTIYEIDRAVLPFLVRNEQVGLACDVERLKACSGVFHREFDATCSRINDLAGYTVNPLSGEQVSDCLFEELGIKPTRRTKGGKHYTTADKYLKARKNEHDIIPLIITARQLNKYMGTYADKLPSMLRDGRYHPDWRYTVTPSGRLTEVIIVLIPKHDPTAKREHRPNRALMIRDCFYATPGHRLVSVDLSQIELRCMAHLSRDEHLLKAYAEGIDIHAQVAHEVFGAPQRKEDQDESAHRLPSKTFNFSIINGTTEYGLLDQLHEQGLLSWDIEQVREALHAWFRIHKGVDRFWQEQQAHCRRTGYVKDLFGRRRYIAAIQSTNEQIRREAERQCLFGIQSTADGISKVWNKRIWRDVILPRHARGQYYCEPWIRVHDDTTLEVDKRIAMKVQREMLALVPDLLRIPTLAEGKIGRRWGSLH